MRGISDYGLVKSRTFTLYKKQRTIVKGVEKKNNNEKEKKET